MIAKSTKEILKKEHSKNHWHGVHSHLGQVKYSDVLSDIMQGISATELESQSRIPKLMYLCDVIYPSQNQREG